MSEVFLRIVNMSISASYFVAAVLLLRLILKKAPKWVNVLLWGLVAVRLVCPFSIESALSLIPSAETIPEQVITQMRVDVQTNIPQMDDPVPDEPETDNRDDTADQTVPDVTEPAKKSIPVVTVLAAVWAVGVAGMLGYTGVSYFLLRRRVATAIRMKDNIYRSENVDSPFVLGFLGPKIYLPFDLRGTDLSHVIAHENAHIRRKDHWWKPVGFVLLALHWFNPIMWVGYILLCRDIELACDEKVIKEMDSKTKADYTEALVACSVNRRVIAACPLAFGEVGVKERVKTVMNYKKPAFWIVIAAIALCVVVAVCFLTNPKDKGPQVGNPQMLEFPGVEWFVTPEEFKEALNITEEQIVDEYMDPEKEDVGNDYDTHYLFVKDLTIFGKKVTYGCFEFRRYPGYDFAFDNAIVMFAEDTDMVALKEEVSEIYGLGVGETYDYFTYENDTKRTRTYKAKMTQQLEYMAHSAIKLEGVEGNPFKDALEDPEYMVHLWITENGTSVIPEEIVTYFKHLMDQPINDDKVVLQDDAKLTEMLDSWPWISISMSNRCMATIYSEAEGRDGEPYSYYTDNYMEFSAQWLWQYMYFSKEYMQNAAEEDTSSLQVDDPSLLEFPGVEWNATPEEVIDALNLTEKQITGERTEDAGSDSLMAPDFYYMGVQDITVFGKKIVEAKLTFLRYGENDFGLAGIEIYYPKDTDMQTVIDEMAACYGEGNLEALVEYTIEDGEIVEHSPSTTMKINGKLWAPEKDPDYVRSFWRSTKKGSEILSAEGQSRMADYYVGLEHLQVSRETALEYLDVLPMVDAYAVNRNHIAAGTSMEEERNNFVRFNATWLVLMTQCFDK